MKASARSEPRPAAAAEADGRVPLVLVTGFLGSGKTTLITRLLRAPRMAGAIVLVNEIGEIGLDHLLVREGRDDRRPVVLLENGCLCCVTNGDLVGALLDLPPPGDGYDRVLVETTGVADPFPVLATLAGEPRLRARFRVSSVAVALDVVSGMKTTAGDPIARRQIDAADLVVLTKPDLVDGTTVRAVMERVQGLNPACAVVVGEEGLDALQDRFAQATARERGAAAPRQDSGNHGYDSVALFRQDPIPLRAVATALRYYAALFGPGLLRMKGVARLAEAPERPAVIQAVRHVLHPVAWLAAWPHQPETRLVAIGRGLDRAALEAGLDAAIMDQRRQRAGTAEKAVAHAP